MKEVRYAIRYYDGIKYNFGDKIDRLNLEYVSDNFHSRKEVMNFVKENIEDIIHFYIDKITIVNEQNSHKKEVEYGKVVYIGELLTKNQMKQLYEIEQEKQIDITWPVRYSMPVHKDKPKTYIISYANGNVYPIYGGAKVLDKNLKQIYPKIGISRQKKESMKNLLNGLEKKGIFQNLER